MMASLSVETVLFTFFLGWKNIKFGKIPKLIFMFDFGKSELAQLWKICCGIFTCVKYLTFDRCYLLTKHRSYFKYPLPLLPIFACSHSHLILRTMSTCFFGNWVPPLQFIAQLMIFVSSFEIQYSNVLPPLHQFQSCICMQFEQIILL